MKINEQTSLTILELQTTVAKFQKNRNALKYAFIKIRSISRSIRHKTVYYVGQDGFAYGLLEVGFSDDAIISVYYIRYLHKEDNHYEHTDIEFINIYHLNEHIIGWLLSYVLKENM